MTYHLITTSLCALAMAASLNAAHAQAADETDDTEARLDTVFVVSSEKREESILDVPASVGLVTGENVVENFLTATEDLVKLDSSLTVGGGRVRIRGVGTDAFDVAAEPSVSFAVDGVVLGRTGQAFLDLVDIERVEVLRGPQGTLYGKNVSAGLVNIITKDADGEFNADMELIMGEDDDVQYNAAFGGALADGVNLRVSGTYKRVGDFTDNPVTGTTTNGEDPFTLRSKLGFDLSESLNAQITGWVRKSDIEGPNETVRIVTDPAVAATISPVIAGPENRQTAVGERTFDNTDEQGAIVELGWEGAGGHRFDSITGWISTDTEARDDVDGRPDTDPVYSGGLTGLGLAGPIILTQIADQEITQYSQEFRLTSPAGPVQYVVGLYGFKLELDDTLGREFNACLPTGLAALPALPVGSPCIDPAVFVGGLPGIATFEQAVGPGVAQVDRVVETESYAAFGQLDWEVAPKWTLTGGLRYQYDETSFNVSQPFPSPPPLGFGFNLGPTIGSTDDSALSGKAAVRFDYAPDANIYASYSRGYKAPTASLQGDQVGRIDAETSDSFELGWKASLHDGRLFAQIAGFWTEYQDFQTETFSPEAASFVLANAGETRTSGFEASFIANPNDRWSIFGGLSYTQAEIESFAVGQCFSPTFLDADCVTSVVPSVNGPIPFQSKDLSGGDLPNSPDWKFNLNARYEAPVGERFLAFGQAGYVWQDDVQYDLSQNPNTIQEAYGLLDLSAGFGDADGHWLVSVFVENAFDQDYASFIFQDFVQRDSVNILQFFDKRSERYVGASLRMSF